VRGKAQVLQRENAPENAPHKRKVGTKPMTYTPKGEKELERESTEEEECADRVVR
jgi:hypothetical protein